MTMSLRRHEKSIMNNTVRRSMSSSKCRRREVTVRMWRAAEDCSTSERQRLEKLGCRRLRVAGTGNRRETKRNADAFETPTLLNDEVHRRDMTVPGREDILKQAASLKSIRQETVSQCSWRRCSVKWSHFDDEKTCGSYSRAVKAAVDMCKFHWRYTQQDQTALLISEFQGPPLAPKGTPLFTDAEFELHGRKE